MYEINTFEEKSQQDLENHQQLDLKVINSVSDHSLSLEDKEPCQE
jgi:hypothetical protein